MRQIYREAPYERRCTATVVAVTADGIHLDCTVFYPMGGGQPGDVGSLRWNDAQCPIVDTRKSDTVDDVVHVPADGAPLPPVGQSVTAEIDWDRRHRHMRMHTAMHLLCSLVDGDVTGGQVGAERSRLDFNVPTGALDKTALSEALNRLIGENHVVTPRWISDEELAARPELVRTMSVQPPMGAGSVRLLQIGEDDAPIDLQPCGGTHVTNTAEIGHVEVAKIENKGRQNRRVVIALTG